ncbi:MAG: DNA-processing protein DprA [Cyclobacteriaceae bacterium]
MYEEKVYQVALSLVQGIGAVTTKTLISYCGTAKSVFTASKSKLNKIPGIGNMTAQAIMQFKAFDEAERELKLCSEKGVQIIFYTDTAYPKRLKHVADAPVLLYLKGQADLNPARSIAIVGTRNATSYGREFLQSFMADLKKHNPLVVSGLAYGIDIAAHKYSLDHNLATLGVMASGMDIIYPYNHKGTAADMCSNNGGLLTEYKMGTKPDAHNFPSRNRIIAAMADAIIVVEAADRGGALITAEIANSYSRDVFAVPGDVNRTYSKGCNQLIRNHKANILTGIKDLEYMLNWDVENVVGSQELATLDLPEDLTEDERLILDTIKQNDNEIMIDELSWKSQINLNKLASYLLNLEFKGIVKALPGKKYRMIRL